MPLSTTRPSSMTRTRRAFLTVFSRCVMMRDGLLRAAREGVDLRDVVLEDGTVEPVLVGVQVRVENVAGGAA